VISEHKCLPFAMGRGWFLFPFDTVVGGGTAAKHHFSVDARHTCSTKHVEKRYI